MGPLDLGGGNASTTVNPFRSAEAPKVSVWIPITVILLLAILSALMVLCSHKFRRLCQKNVQSDRGQPRGIHTVQMTLNATNDRNSVPETPPPAYASLERQFSYVSHISQNSSQIEIPPDYDEVSQTTINSSPEMTLHSLKNQDVMDAHHVVNTKIFSRSISALESRRPSYSSAKELHFSSSVVDSHSLICGTLEAGCSNQMDVPDVIRETSPKKNQYNSGDPNSQKDDNLTDAASSEVVFTISEDSFKEHSTDETFHDASLTMKII